MLTPYIKSTDIILNLGTDPEDRPELDDDGLKSKFDENSKNIVEWANDTLLPEMETVKIVEVSVSKTLNDSDAYTMQNCTHESVPITLTVPKDVFAVGTQIAIRQDEEAECSVSADTDVTINQTKLKLKGKGTTAVLFQIRPNVWDFIGATKE